MASQRNLNTSNNQLNMSNLSNISNNQPNTNSANIFSNTCRNLSKNENSENSKSHLNFNLRKNEDKTPDRRIQSVSNLMNVKNSLSKNSHTPNAKTMAEELSLKPTEKENCSKNSKKIFEKIEKLFENE